MKKFEKIDPERLTKSAEVFAELRADRFFWKASGYTYAELERPGITEGVLVAWHLAATQFPDGAMLQRRL
jgi:hypothetical protein